MGLTAARNDDLISAPREWTPLLKQGNVDSQFLLGEMCSEGQGVKQD
tara:strand:+ start:1176 stop:1316 length:141 start_codon:yes stop_codon:yes gene_type:complete